MWGNEIYVGDGRQGVWSTPYFEESSNHGQDRQNGTKMDCGGGANEIPRPRPPVREGLHQHLGRA